MKFIYIFISMVVFVQQSLSLDLLQVDIEPSQKTYEVGDFFEAKIFFSEKYLNSKFSTITVKDFCEKISFKKVKIIEIHYCGISKNNADLVQLDFKGVFSGSIETNYLEFSIVKEKFDFLKMKFSVTKKDTDNKIFLFDFKWSDGLSRLQWIAICGGFIFLSVFIGLLIKKKFIQRKSVLGKKDCLKMFNIQDSVEFIQVIYNNKKMIKVFLKDDDYRFFEDKLHEIAFMENEKIKQDNEHVNAIRKFLNERIY